MVLPLIMGGLSFGTQAFGALASFNSQKDAARAQNRQNMRIYKQQMQNQVDQYNRDITAYTLRKAQYGEQLLNNQTAAGRAYVGEQQRLNEIMKQLAFEDQAANIERVQSLGKVAASGQAGGSATRNMVMAAAAKGRDKAVRDAIGDQAKDMALYRAESIRDQLRASNRQAYYNVGAAPVMGGFAPAPMQQTGPSQLGLWANLGQAALSGVQSYIKYS